MLFKSSSLTVTDLPTLIFSITQVQLKGLNLPTLTGKTEDPGLFFIFNELFSQREGV